MSEELVSAAEAAIESGFIHLDGAEVYGTEAEIGEAIKRSGISRDKLFITTKVYPKAKDVEGAFEDSLKKLGVDYVDLYLLHAPFVNEEEHGTTVEKAWRGVEKVYESGRARAIGVSNFRVQDLEELLKYAKVPPALNQIEYHPYNQQDDLLAFHKEHGIVTAAYGSLVPLTTFAGVSKEFDATLEELSKKHQRSKGQILLRWAIDQGVVVVTTTQKEQRLKEYLKVLEFQLSEEDIQLIKSKGKGIVKRAFWTKYLGPNP